MSKIFVWIGSFTCTVVFIWGGILYIFAVVCLAAACALADKLENL